MQKFFCILILISFYSCTKKSSPEGALRSFIQYRFDKSQSRDELIDMTTGALQEKISTMGEEDLEKFLDVKDLKRRKLTVLIKNCEVESCFLTYVLRYSQGKENPMEFGVEVKKIAKVEKIEKSWKLAEISNVKTYIDSKKSLDVSAQGESKAP
jgi:hypothetical protein